MALVHRGPDAQGLVKAGKITLGHTRLAILDLDPRSNQPFIYGDVRLVFNGEIWNYKQVKQELTGLGYEFNTAGDTEVVAAALSAWGADALSRLDGMFAIAWTVDGETLYLARDRFGEMPLHVAKQNPFYFASERKALLAMGCAAKSIDDVQPGHYVSTDGRRLEQRRYYLPPIAPAHVTRKQASSCLFDLLKAGTENRAISDVPVCTLLSGGIDSSIAALFLKGLMPGIVAYTAVFNPRSSDLKAAREVARSLGIELREVPIPVPSPDDLAETVNVIEMNYKAQVEIGWPCLVLARRMRADGFKVTFSGEGSDELWASYGFAYHALKTNGWHEYRRDLFLAQARKNFIRCNKVFMAHSIECPLPFLHYPLVEYALSLPQAAVQDGRSRPKAVLQDAFVDKLPDTITRRPKVAFQDGLGLKRAIESVLRSPERFYHAEYKRRFG